MSLTFSVSTDEMERLLGKAGVRCVFTEQERVSYSTTPVVDPAARVFAYPIPADNSALTLSNLRNTFGTDPRQQPSFFDHPWYVNEGFMGVRASPGWHVLSMDVLEDSINQPPAYIRSVAAQGMELASAIDVVLMLFLYYLQTGEQLLSRKHTWCADSAGIGEQVTVGAFGRNGVFLSKHPTNYASRVLGICPKITGDFPSLRSV